MRRGFPVFPPPRPWAVACAHDAMPAHNPDTFCGRHPPAGRPAGSRVVWCGVRQGLCHVSQAARQAGRPIKQTRMGLGYLADFTHTSPDLPLGAYPASSIFSVASSLAPFSRPPHAVINVSLPAAPASAPLLHSGQVPLAQAVRSRQQVLMRSSLVRRCANAGVDCPAAA